MHEPELNDFQQNYNIPLQNYNIPPQGPIPQTVIAPAKVFENPFEIGVEEEEEEEEKNEEKSDNTKVKKKCH